MALVDDIRAAKYEMMARGRCTGQISNLEGQVCLMGAIGMATIDGFEDLAREDQAEAMGRVEHNWRSRAVVLELRKHLKPRAFELWASERVWQFNDDKNNADDDVFNLFDKALADLGGMR